MNYRQGTTLQVESLILMLERGTQIVYTRSGKRGFIMRMNPKKDIAYCRFWRRWSGSNPGWRLEDKMCSTKIAIRYLKPEWYVPDHIVTEALDLLEKSQVDEFMKGLEDAN